MTAVLRQTCFVPSVPEVVAQHLGLFEESGLELDTALTRSSDQQREDLLSGERDMAVTAIDNLLVWNDRGGDFRLVAQIEKTTSLGLYARPGLRGLTDLSGTRFAVDAAGNGFAIVARHLLAAAEVDGVQFIEIGGVRERLASLVEGRADATLLGPPLDEMAEGAGFVKLLAVNDGLADYPGQGLVVQESRIPELLPRLRPYLQSLDRAVAWCNEAAPEQGFAILRQAGFGERSCRTGWETRPAGLTPSAAGLQLLVRMRQDLGRLPASFEGINSIWEAALLQDALAG